MPKWLKIVLGVLVAGIILSVVLFGGCVAFIFNVSKQAQDPAQIAKVASEIITTSDPLPQGFSYKMGLNMDMFHIKWVLASFEPTHLFLMIGKMPAQPNQTPEEIAASLAEKGVQGAGAPLEVKTKGTDKVAGQTMNYVLGTATTKTGEKMPAFMGVMATPDTKSIIFVYGTHKNIIDEAAETPKGGDAGKPDAGKPSDKGGEAEKAETKIPEEFDLKDTMTFLHAIKEIPN